MSDEWYVIVEFPSMKHLSDPINGSAAATTMLTQWQNCGKDCGAVPVEFTPYPWPIGARVRVYWAGVMAEEGVIVDYNIDRDLWPIVRFDDGSQEDVDPERIAPLHDDD